MSNPPPTAARAPRQYVRPVRADWWLQKKSYTLFMLRELTAVFAAGYAIFLIVLIYQATRGDMAFDACVLGLMSPLSIILHAVVFLMVLYHTYTWFSLLPKVAVFWRGEEKLSGSLLVGANWVAWLVLMALVIGFVMQGGKRMAKSNEPVWWSLFAAGGVTAAFLIPAAILITGVAIPLGWMSSDQLYALIHHPLIRFILFAAIAPTLFHGAHRTLHTLVELGLKPARAALAFLLYGGAILGTLLTAYLLIRMGG